MKQKTFPVLFLLLSTGFVNLYLILSWNNRLPYEDYYFTSLTHDKGAINAMLEVYNNYSARWSAHTLAFYFSKFHSHKFSLPVFSIITLIILIASFFLLLKTILIQKLKFQIKTSSLFPYTLLFTICFFFSSYDIGQVWFWYMVSWMYMWSIIAGNFLLWLLLRDNLKTAGLAFIIILSAYIAGAAESYAMIYIFLLAAISIMKMKNSLPLFTKNIQNRTLIISLVSLLAFYLITVLAPGTWARKDMLRDANFIEHVIMVAKAFGIIVLRQTPKLIPYLFLLGIPWMILGGMHPSSKKIKLKSALPIFLKSVLFMGTLALILIIPASWILYDLPPARALSQVSLLLSAYVSFIFFYIGYKIQIPKKITNPIILFALCISVCILSFHIVNQYSIASRFSKEYDKRIEYLSEENNSGRKNTAFLAPLALSGMIYSDDLSTDSASNEFFEKTYNLKFHVAVKKE